MLLCLLGHCGDLSAQRVTIRRQGKKHKTRAGLSLKPFPPYRLLGHKRTRLPYMSTIELVDPELRDALAEGPLLPPLTAETLRERRASALALIAAVPIPNLPDIATDEIHVESALAQSRSGF